MTTAASAAATAASATETTVMGWFESEDETSVWPFRVAGTTGTAGTVDVSVLSSALPVVDVMLEYQLVGVVSKTKVFHVRHAAVRRGEWSDRLSVAAHGALVRDLRDEQPSKLAKSERKIWWDAAAGYVEAWRASGGDSRAFAGVCVPPQNDLVDAVARATIHKGRAAGKVVDGNPRESHVAEAVSAGRVVVMGDDDDMALRETRVAAELIAAAMRGVAVTIIDAFDCDADAAVSEHGPFDVVIRQCGLLGVDEVLDALCDAQEPATVALVGKPRLATRVTAYALPPALPRVHVRVPHVFPVVATWDGEAAATIGGSGSGSGGAGGKQLWVAPPESVRWYERQWADDYDPANPATFPKGPWLRVRRGLGVLYATADEGDLESAKRAAGGGRAGFARPNVGWLFRDRNTHGVVRVTGVDEADAATGAAVWAAPVVAVTAAAAPAATTKHEKRAWWKRFAAFDACLARDVVPVDVVVLIATHELTAADIARAYDCARVALVVVGKFSVAALEAVIKAGAGATS